MNVDVRVVGGVTILDVQGRMIAENTGRPFVTAVRRMHVEGSIMLLVNLEGVRQIDTTGLTELVEAYTATKRAGGQFKLEYVPRHIHELLRITQLLNVIGTFDVETEAVASFGVTVVT